MSTLDNILRSLVVRSGGKPSTPLQGGPAVWSPEAVAKQQIKDLVLGFIGPDERYETPPGNRDRIARNELRADLRKKVEEL
jgi:hypothetical protein